MSIELKISKPGVDVNKAQPKELQYAFPYNAFMIYDGNNGVADSSGHATIAHDLGVPTAFMTYDNNNWKGGDCYSMNFASFINASNLNIRTGNSKKYAYKIFANALDGKITKRLESDVYMNFSKEGKDVTSQILGDMSLTSELGSAQIWKKVSLTVGGLAFGASGEAEILHGFDFIPAFIANCLAFGGTGQVDGTSLPGTIIVPGSGLVTVEVAADINKIYLKVTSSILFHTNAGATIDIWIYDKLI